LTALRAVRMRDEALERIEPEREGRRRRGGRGSFRGGGAKADARRRAGNDK
jgi:hypothetical protein